MVIREYLAFDQSDYYICLNIGYTSTGRLWGYVLQFIISADDTNS